MKRVNQIFVLTLNICLYSISSSASELPSTDNLSVPYKAAYIDTPEYKNNKRKILYTNIGLTSGLIWYGLDNWNWGKESFHTDNERWLSDDTQHGGADKLGHLYTGYVITRLASSLYKSWGLPPEKAVKEALITSIIITSVMEIGDGSSSTYGFSREDFISNTIGQLAGYYLETHPEMDKKIDLRIEYDFSATDKGFDPTSNYSSMKFLMALKASGFKSLNKGPLKYLELHFGYYSRGFDNPDAYSSPERHYYTGIGINVSELLRQLKFKKTAKVFEYIQIPGTYVE